MINPLQVETSTFGVTIKIAIVKTVIRNQKQVIVNRNMMRIYKSSLNCLTAKKERRKTLQSPFPFNNLQNKAKQRKVHPKVEIASLLILNLDLMDHYQTSR